MANELLSKIQERAAQDEEDRKQIGDNYVEPLE